MCMKHPWAGNPSKMYHGVWLGRALWEKGRVQMGRRSWSRLSPVHRAGTDALHCAVPTPCPKIVL